MHDQGYEPAHLREMARRTSIRGTDLRLLFGEECLEMPYPAYRWYWHEVLSYAWRTERHINEGEVAAFNIMLKRRAKDPAKHKLRYLAVVDSSVTSGAVSTFSSTESPPETNSGPGFGVGPVSSDGLDNQQMELCRWRLQAPQADRCLAM